MRTTSLRLRVIVGVLGLLVVVLVAGGFLIERTLGAQLRGDLQQRLVDRAGYGRMLADQGLRGQDLADALAGDGIDVEYRVDGSTLVGAPAATRGGPPAPPPRAHATTSADATVTTTTQAISVAENVGDGRITVSASQIPIRQTLTHLRTIELLAGLGVLAVVGLLLTRVVAVALRPLSSMTELAGRIARGGRGGRLRPGNPRTELGRTAAAFDQMLHALEAVERDARSAAAAATAAEERMRQLLADVSHELRTPVASLQARAETLLRDNPPRAEREDLALGMVRETRRAARLVDDLLLMNRLEHAPVDQLRRRPLDLAALVGGLVAEQRLLDTRLRISLHGASDVVVDGDPERLAQIVTNLVDNARHATGRGGPITVSVSRRAHTAFVEVSDHGPGVAPAERERIFDRFVRLDAARSRADGGSGLGLPIARALARAHGGDVVCAAPEAPAAPDVGARFVLTVPALVRPTALTPVAELVPAGG